MITILVIEDAIEMALKNITGIRYIKIPVGDSVIFCITNEGKSQVIQASITRSGDPSVVVSMKGDHSAK